MCEWEGQSPCTYLCDYAIQQQSLETLGEFLFTWLRFKHTVSEGHKQAHIWPLIYVFFSLNPAQNIWVGQERIGIVFTLIKCFGVLSWFLWLRMTRLDGNPMELRFWPLNEMTAVHVGFLSNKRCVRTKQWMRLRRGGEGKWVEKKAHNEEVDFVAPFVPRNTGISRVVLHSS